MSKCKNSRFAWSCISLILVCGLGLLAFFGRRRVVSPIASLFTKPKKNAKIMSCLFASDIVIAKSTHYYYQTVIFGSILSSTFHKTINKVIIILELEIINRLMNSLYNSVSKPLYCKKISIIASRSRRLAITGILKLLIFIFKCQTCFSCSITTYLLGVRRK